ncbi:MAG: T9SS type A sorting domain-containing protein [Flavobacterium sp.]
MKKITLLALLALSFNSFSQVLIDPAGAGGFELGPTWADNGWTVVNSTNANGNKKWYLGTGQAGYTGARAAFIGNDETTAATGNGARKIHFYREVTFPAGATNIVLSFKVKQEVLDAGFDYIQVNTAQAVPVNNQEPPGTVQFDPFPEDDPVPTFTTQTVNLPNSLAGTTRYLIFTFISDNAEPRGFPAIDAISLTYQAPASTADFNQKQLKYYPNPVNDILSLSYPEALTGVQIYNVLGQKVVSEKLNSQESHVDMSSLMAGPYIVKVTSVSGVSKTIKITKK